MYRRKVVKNVVHPMSFILISRKPLMTSPSGKFLLVNPWSEAVSDLDETPLWTPFYVKGDPISCLDETLVIWPSNGPSFSTLYVLTFILVPCGWVLNIGLLSTSGNSHFDQSPCLLILLAYHKKTQNVNNRECMIMAISDKKNRWWCWPSLQLHLNFAMH